MNRQHFIKSIKDSFTNNFIDNEDDIFHFTMILNGRDDNQHLAKLYIASMFSDFTETHSLKLIDITQLSCIKKEIDWDYCDKHPDDDTYCFRTSINLNILYDELIILNNINTPLTTIYRISTVDNRGLYDSFFASLSVEDHHPSPSLEDTIKSIFNHNLKGDNMGYKYNWNFGFETVELAYKWIGDSNINRLSSEGFKLSSIKIPSAFVVHGNSQSIYQEAKVTERSFLDIESIRPQSNKKISKLSLS